MSIKLNSNEKYIITLLRSVLNNSIPPEKPEDVSFEKVYSIAKYHNIANMLFYAINKLEKKPNSEIFKRWKERYYKGISRDLIQKSELEKILNIFEKNQIKNIVLKGFELKKLYPKSDMRFMSDIDILISKKNAEKVSLIMNELGYKTMSYGKEKDDIYFKEPIMNVEIHNALFNIHYKKYNSFFKNLDEMKNLISKTKYQYNFSNEDFFLFLFIHTVKHYLYSGIGIRIVMDIYLYLKAKEKILNWDYINNSLQKLELLEFFKIFNHFTKTWFEDEKESEIDIEIGKYIFNSGTYGNTKNNRLNILFSAKEINIKKSKVKSIFSIIFPSLEIMQISYPILKKLPFFLPIFFIIRGLKVILFKRKNLNYISDIFKINKDDLNKRKDFHSKTGLK
ncbi:nucleotidyltransferase family protein [uncultured Fusobacterium sp.]|uniref:nucleotidyltransferase domain-containing protein n=1 Tax=uncultured Fusobacterium sp. TaxID=159267 RepID=UPI00265EE757|nr:nucleotidyltransferase family protein [uncultured Fusobacterium sp.]